MTAIFMSEAKLLLILLMRALLRKAICDVGCSEAAVNKFLASAGPPLKWQGGSLRAVASNNWTQRASLSCRSSAELVNAAGDGDHDGYMNADDDSFLKQVAISVGNDGHVNSAGILRRQLGEEHENQIVFVVNGVSYGRHNE